LANLAILVIKEIDQVRFYVWTIQTDQPDRRQANFRIVAVELDGQRFRGVPRQLAERLNPVAERFQPRAPELGELLKLSVGQEIGEGRQGQVSPLYHGEE